MLGSFADDPTGSPSPERKGAVCAPADPAFDAKAFTELMQTTKTDPDEWGYPVSADVEVRATPQANGAVIEKLALAFVRVMPEGGPNVPAFLRVVTPAGKRVMCPWIRSRPSATTRSATSRTRAAGKSAAISAAVIRSSRSQTRVSRNAISSPRLAPSARVSPRSNRSTASRRSPAHTSAKARRRA